MRIAFYAPLKPPGHPVPSGDRRMARLLIDALGHGGHAVELAAVFRSWEGAGDGARQDRLRRLGAKLAALWTASAVKVVATSSPRSVSPRYQSGSDRRP